MSSSRQATPPTSNHQLIIGALADYAQITGIDLAKNPFAAAIKQSSSPEDILQLLHEREKAFKEYRDGNRRMINYLTPAVNVIQVFSGILGGAVRLVSQFQQQCDLVDLCNYRELVRSPFHQQVFCLLGSMSSLLYVLKFSNGFFLIYRYARLPVGLPPVTMHY